MRWWDGCDEVHCGFWINWSFGPIYGSTLTLPTQWAIIITSFLALFVNLVGGHLWAMVCFIIHQFNASSQDQDDMHQQFQLILRNTETQASFVWKLLKVGFAHRNARRRALTRPFWLLALAGGYGLSSWAAGGLSSRFVAGNNNVRVIPGTCGWMKEVPLGNITDKASFEATNALVVMGRYAYRKSASYSRTCYDGTDGNSTSCGYYVRPTLPYNATLSQSCPFAGTICRGPSISLDTGFLRSDEHLGFNTRPEDAMLMRKVLTCAPLASEKYIEDPIQIPDDIKIRFEIFDEIRYTGYRLGTYLEPGNPMPEFTFSTSNIHHDFGDLPYGLALVSAFINYRGDQETSFDPIPELQSNNSDVTILSLMSRIKYSEPIDDLWFDAKNCTESALFGQACTRTQPLSHMGCQERYQFCTSDGTSCSPFTGLYGTNSTLESSSTLNPTQTALYALLWKLAWRTQINFQFTFIGSENLVANNYLWDGGSWSFGFSAALPSNHWHREVKNWMSVSLSEIQRATVAFAQPPDFDIGSGMPVHKYIEEPTDETTRLLCHKIEVKSAAHTSLSVLGLFLTLSVGLLLIVLSLCVPMLVSYSQKYTGRGLHKRLEWIETSTFQLQRMAAEGHGIGPWKGREDDVPTLARHNQPFNLTRLNAQERLSRVESYEAVNGREVGEANYNMKN